MGVMGVELMKPRRSEKQTSWAQAYVCLVASNLLKEPAFFQGSHVIMSPVDQIAIR